MTGLPFKKKDNYVEQHSSGILRVAIATNPNRLASAITKSLVQHKGRISVRAAGGEPVNTAVKSLIIANGIVAQHGKTLFIVPTFDVVAGAEGSGSEVTIISFDVSLVTIPSVAKLYESV